jgi:hypothetical protein
VHVRIVGVVVTNGGPAQLAAQVLLHPLHEPIRVVAQVQIISVLRRNDESELPLFAGDLPTEYGPVYVTAFVEQASLGTILFDAVAYMRPMPALSRRCVVKARYVQCGREGTKRRAATLPISSR